MKPATLNLSIYKGSTFLKEIQWKTGDPALPVNITGCSLRMQIRAKVNDATVVDDLTTANSRIVITDAVNGKFTFEIPADTSSAYAISDGVYDLEIVFPGGAPVYRLLEGSVSAAPEVTRS